jgi:hypothetical protein
MRSNGGRPSVVLYGAVEMNRDDMHAVQQQVQPVGVRPCRSWRGSRNRSCGFLRAVGTVGATGRGGRVGKSGARRIERRQTEVATHRSSSRAVKSMKQREALR